ncbi:MULTISPECIES: CDP-diacylglycerol--glycerol-3-phosphate 3-phosphatidyltransferase [Thermoanaerobacter]|uniref:CDP-diacylglycerol--glycerol-3-phosphate 3-phosphatidyltransferase n=2 Tax=Thermoanaerobacteraceae TaxID=186814 RepID=UPI00048C6A73|nr:CDP-diacylglycerol--glycerol-3-phosphate 3-phosphatidyltransferase [Thermoanaerobacter thermocopriae]
MNIPNFLTFIRFLLIPLFVYTFFYVPEGNTYAAAIFILSGITDILDGYIARHYNQVTKIGTLLDPLVDKLMILTVLTSLWIRSLIPFFVIAILMVKELSMIIGAAILYKKQEIAIPANKYGKAATLFFYIAIIFSIFKWPYRFTLVIIALLLAVLAFVVYALEFYKKTIKIIKEE